VSKWFQEYSAPFKHSLNLADFSVILDEKEFLIDPCGKLESLKSIPEEEIRKKVDALAHAQRIMFPDHPRSLFVPSFLEEVRQLEMDKGRVLGRRVIGL